MKKTMMKILAAVAPLLIAGLFPLLSGCIESRFITTTYRVGDNVYIAYTETDGSTDYTKVMLCNIQTDNSAKCAEQQSMTQISAFK